MNQNLLLNWCAKEAVHNYENITDRLYRAGATPEQLIAHYEFITGNSLRMLKHAARQAGHQKLAQRVADYMYQTAIS